MRGTFKGPYLLPYQYKAQRYLIICVIGSGGKRMVDGEKGYGGKVG